MRLRLTWLTIIAITMNMLSNFQRVEAGHPSLTVINAFKFLFTKQLSYFEDSHSQYFEAFQDKYDQFKLELQKFCFNDKVEDQIVEYIEAGKKDDLVEALTFIYFEFRDRSFDMVEILFQIAVCEERMQPDDTIFNYYDLETSLSKAKEYAEFQLVIPQLYLGSYFSTLDVDAVAKNNITKIIKINHDYDCSKDYPLNISYVCYYALDEYFQTIEESLPSFLEQVRETINKGENVLVVCSGGVSRSPAFAIAYLMIDKGMCYQEALETLKSARKYTKPCTSFENQLKSFVKKQNIDREACQNYNIQPSNFLQD